MKKKFILLLTVLSFSCGINAQENEKEIINKTLDQWHDAAAQVDKESYFSYFTDEAIYIGTDSTEIWTKQQFYEWSTPHFESGKAWSFTVNSRNIYLDESGKLAWFDELIDYGKGTLRGSGVLSKQSDGWKIRHYVLSLPVPNDKFTAVVEVLDEVPEIEEREE